MTATEKFLFDTVFEPGGASTPVAQTRPEKTYWTKPELDIAKAESFERGKQAGITEVNSKLEAQTSAALQTIATNVVGLTKQLEDERTRLKSEGVILAKLIAKSLTSKLIEREPLLEIEGLFKEALSFLPGTPHIVVRVNDTLLEAANECLSNIAAERGFLGKLVLLGEPEIQSGDCRIEWAQGGMVKDREMVVGKIREITVQHVDVSMESDDLELTDFDTAAFPDLANHANSESPDNWPLQSSSNGTPEEM